jgi:hypothetical protein
VSATYLFGRVGPFGVLVPAAVVAHVRAPDEQLPGPPADAPAPDPVAVVDLRALFSCPASGAGPHITLRTSSGLTAIVVDHVASLHRIADTEFRPLPAGFDYARNAFDALCRRSIEGILCLRLRDDPRFVAMAAWREMRPNTGPQLLSP